MFNPRPRQQEVLNYKGGRMGVAAVPGSGKTRTLSALAARLIAEGGLQEDQEVLIVTLVNSAVDNFARQVKVFLQEQYGLLPNVGYRVRTLHGLCNDIVRDNPSRVMLEEGFQIVDEREAAGILADAAQTWARTNPRSADAYLPPDMDDSKRDWVVREQWPGLVTDIASSFVKSAKDAQLTPEDIRYNLDRFGSPLPLADMCQTIYANYQRGLSYRGAVDFQDLIRLALKSLESDETYLKRLRKRWKYILEDEAQDSSLLQERILRLLVGADGNWVRVGDPNQAIYETFTTAKPEHLWNFLNEADVERRELPNSGRSAPPIIDLANFLIDWTRERHPDFAIRRREPLQPPHIEPAPPGDPQPNPPAESAKISLFGRSLTPAEEIEAVVRSLAQWLPQHPDETAAVLVPRNKRGYEIVDALKALRNPDIEYVELLQSTTSTREAAGALGNILQYLSDPSNAKMLATVYKVWRRDEREDETLATRLENVARRIRACPRVEDYLWPQLGRDWLRDDAEIATLTADDPELLANLMQFRGLVRRWQEAVLLPIDQLILILSQDLFQSSADLAIAHSVAVVLRTYSDQHPDWRLPNFTDELAVIARNERRFLGIDDDNRGFDPERHKGKVAITTMHSAKGLEWDRVYLLSVNSYDFPSGMPNEQYMAEKWFIRAGLSLEAEALAQLHVSADPLTFEYLEGEATKAARLDYIAERLRLLYVGITRARKELIITWNTGRRGDQQQAVPFVALQTHVESQTT
ncbi:MAG TPA: ATP-dependent helicase [Phototrophicaceae bacterium]|nr:ATP-dependent helicase [Phototrophicaceae bacterium]